VEPRTLNTPRTFPEITSARQWRTRAAEIRTQILVSAGLWPRPQQPPVKAIFTGRAEFGDFSVEHVRFETWPGFWVGANLYRPLGQGPGPFPAILNPHGHWKSGRLEDTADCSIPGRCINFARQGMIALAFDMAGYNDSQFAQPAGAGGYNTHRVFGTNQTDLLYPISLMGLQTWNSLCALDLLASLPGVDPKRLGCTGASGGGTQTFILAALDDRLAALAPMVMLSHTMQGGCSCENMPGLRIDYSNLEIGACAAPRPLQFTAATGDWTRMTLTMEGPAIAGVYARLGATDRVNYDLLPFNHNYNHATRQTAYRWFGRWLTRRPGWESLQDQPWPPADTLPLRATNTPAADGKTVAEMTEWLRSRTRTLAADQFPGDRASLRQWQTTMTPAYRHVLQVDLEPAHTWQEELGTDGQGRRQAVTGHRERGSRVPVLVFPPTAGRPLGWLVLAHGRSRTQLLEAGGQPGELARQLRARGFGLVLPELFLCGELARPDLARKRNPQYNFFTTYNRTDAQERTQDLINACHYARTLAEGRPVVLCGLAQAGWWAQMAAPAADAVVADCGRLDPADDTRLLDPDLVVPGIRSLNDFAGILALNAPRPVTLFNAQRFQAERLTPLYTALKATPRLQIVAGELAGEELAARVEQAAQAAR
jgi:dienelactone hydrolase